LKSLSLNSNQLSGIYPLEIFKFCDQLSWNSNIDEFNNFDVSWNEFCTWGDYAYTNVCNFEDWTALKVLYESTNGDNWANRSGWEDMIDNINTPPTNCNLRKLYGVELDSLRVYRLDLCDNQLSGSIPDELGNLTNLERLHLSGNQLSGSIPADLGNLMNLERLYLSDNDLSGIYPSEIFRLCTQLSQYSGKIDKSNNFDVSWNRFCKWGSHAYVNICNLEDWTTLKALYESTNGDNWANRSGWEVLIDNVNAPPTNCNLRDLYGVKLDSFRVVALNLSNNLLGGSLPAELGNLTNLTDLWLSNNQINGSIPNELGSLANLRGLWLSDNQISSSLPSTLGGLTNLERLYLDNNQLSGNLPAELGKLTNLTALNLYDNRFIGSLPAELGDLTNLKNLSLARNQLSDSIPSELGKLTNLTDLSLAVNHFSGSLPPELGKLTNLTYLDLLNNQLTGDIPKELGQLTNLNTLHLRYNQLTGNLPPELGELTNLGSLSLQHNQLSGNIPIELGNLNSLYNLDLKYNYFTCENIPSNLQQISNLSYLPQLFKPENYNNIKSNVFDTLSVERSLNVDIDFPFNTKDFTFQWFRNGDILSGATQATLNFDTIKPSNAGKYTLQLQSENCLPGGNTFYTTSEPIYVILKGYDLLGQPVDYTQLMVEYENKQTKDLYEKEIFLDNGGIWADKCNCNRELHLYTFPNDSSSIEQAYIALDKKIKSIRPRSNIDGGFNYKLNNISLNATFVQASEYRNPLKNFRSQNEDNTAYTVQYDYQTGSYSDEVQVYILDSGLDERNFSDVNDLLLANAPVDSCYNFGAPGYNFTTVVSNLKDYTVTIDTNYQDSEGHGTFGFRSISQGLQEAGNAKIIPLKIIESATGGNLFDLVCAMYHAIDHNADVINLSAGYSGEASGILADAIYEARQKGVFVVTAAGNDGLNIDNEEVVPQYPAYYDSQLHEIYEYNNLGELDTLFIPYDNLITVGAVDVNNQLNQHSNYGKKSVTLAAPGENIFGHGLRGEEVIGTGTSIAAFLTTQVLAREIARDNGRTLSEIWADFESRYLVSNPNLTDVTSSGKQINFNWTGAEVNGCTDCTACNYFPYATKDDGSCLPDFVSISDADEKLMQANDSIVSDQVIQPFDTVAYKAGQQIILENGFEVNTNTSFSAEIKCGNGAEIECGE